MKISEKNTKSFEKFFVKRGENECWLWEGGLCSGGYGQFTLGGGKAHRYSYMVYVGKIPKGLFVCHKCDVTRCINPNHLFLGTYLDNFRDMKEKGRSARGERNRGAKLIAEQVLEIRAMYALLARSRGNCRARRNTEGNVASIAAQYGVSAGAIHRIIARDTWKHI